MGFKKEGLGTGWTLGYCGYHQRSTTGRGGGRSNSDLQHVRIRYHFVARNANELSVQPGEVLEVRMTLSEEVEEDGEQGRTGLRYTVLENNKQWRLLRNRSGQSGYVPCNVLEEVKPGEQQYNRAALFNSQAVNPYKVTSAGPVNHAEVVEMNKSSRDKDSTYLLSVRCICCDMESVASLLKKCREVRNEFGVRVLLCT
ncbi:uncharacterized protein eps8b [Carassius gibelio]|uniref:uncharacterized protein eps8b n=1 Tax=Carassius gibelio TaxID=101364 RepID=UPI002279C5EA|nr:uncharacterized protein eps8b [Carassius gibelio]